MKKIKKILAPTDLSDLSKSGLRYALEMAMDQGAELIAYHVIGYEEANPHDEGFHSESLAKWLFEERKRLLSEFLRENFADIVSKVTIRQEIGLGLADEKILEKAVEEGVDLIVMSTHGRTGLLHLLIGSVTEKVVRKATCPVLSIRPMKETKPAQATTVEI